MMVDLRVASNAPPEADLGDESDFKIQNLQSTAIAQVDLWVAYKPRLYSLFCSKASKGHTLSIQFLKKNDILFTF